MLRGRCRQCHEPISARYPMVELTSAALAVAVVLVKHTWAERVLGLVLVAILIPVALIDFDERIIPNKITAPAAVLAIVIGLLMKPSGVPEQLIAGAAAGGFLLIFALVYPQGMGMGDVKLAAVMGLYLGRSVAVAVIVGTLVATIFGVAVMARVGVQDGRKTAVPFGPFLALGGVVAVLFGPADRPLVPPHDGVAAPAGTMRRRLAIFTLAVALIAGPAAAGAHAATGVDLPLVRVYAAATQPPGFTTNAGQAAAAAKATPTMQALHRREHPL